MASRFLRQLHRAALRRDGGGLPDGQLLSCFIESRDEAAFEALVKRHGAMVLGVCRRVLGNHHDAEDAFQATFLVLARRAGCLRARELVGNWLYGTAYRTALEARATLARRRTKERQVAEMPQPEVEPDTVWRELRPFLDQELSRLPEKYRMAIVLCDLEGHSRKEVARHLKVPEGTLSSRLATARRLLASRLARYGLAVSGATLVSALASGAASACVSPSLLKATAVASVALFTGGMLPARVLSLTDGVMKTMFLSKLKTVVAVAFVGLVSAAMVGVSYRPASAGDPPKFDRPLADELEALRLEVQALRKGLDATRERVKTLELEAKARASQAAPAAHADSVARYLQDQAREQVDLKVAERTRLFLYLEANTDPVSEAEAALKKLRQNPNDQQAIDALEKALKRLKEPKGAIGKPQTK
jgi:RNA polymerase sigma factor (sigma-70 family)